MSSLDYDKEKCILNVKSPTSIRRWFITVYVNFNGDTNYDISYQKTRINSSFNTISTLDFLHTLKGSFSLLPSYKIFSFTVHVPDPHTVLTPVYLSFPVTPFPPVPGPTRP